MVTVITKTIGSGKDYASFTLAEADVTNIGTSADLVANDEAIVFEADAGTYNELVTFDSTLTTDATRNVTYKPAAGSEHGGLSSAGVRLGTTPGANIHWVYDSHQQNIGIVALSRWYVRGLGCVQDGMRFSDNARSENFSGAFGVYTWKNCVFYNPGSGDIFINAASPSTINVYNCTFTGPGNKVNAQGTQPYTLNFVNNLAFGTSTVWNVSGSVTVTGSNNFGSSTNPFPVAIQGSPYPITATTNRGALFEAVDYAVYDGRTGSLADTDYNDVWQQGVGPASNSDVPTTDIRGVARSGASCNPGAFETDAYESPDVRTITVGPDKDYANIALAEANIPLYVTGTDLVASNQAVEIVVDDGLYDQKLTFALGGYTLGPQNSVTLRAATAGRAAVGGVVIRHGSGETGSLVYCAMDNMLISGVRLEHNGVNGNIFTAVNPGARMEDCFATTPSGAVSGFASTYCDATQPFVAKNSVFDMGAASGLGVNASNSSRGIVGGVIVVNCTSAGSTQGSFNVASSGNDMHARFINCLALHPTLPLERTIGAGTDLFLTGSGNIGVAGGKAFPTNISANSQAWNVTKDTRAVSDGTNAIYDSATYKLTDAEGNDAIYVGTSPASDSDVPATDIVGITRGLTTTNVGAFQRLKHIWTDIMATSRDSVDVLGVLKIGADYINAKETVLTATGASGTDDTPMIPLGTTALWIQHKAATGTATDVAETCTLTVHLSASTTMDLLDFGTFSVPTQNSRLGYYQLPIEVTSTDGTYPFIRATNTADVDAAESHIFRIIAIGEPGPSWS